MKKISVLMTRPVAQARSLSQQLEQAGAYVFHCPVIAIKGLEQDNQPRADVVIYVSQNAVIHGFLSNQSYPAIGIGPATTQQLQSMNAKILDHPLKPYNSEALLNMAWAQNVQDKVIRIVKAKGGRPLLREALIERGAVVEEQWVYERNPIELAHKQISEFIQMATPRLVIAASSEVIEVLEKNTDGTLLEQLKAQTVLVAMSQRVSLSAKQHLWQNITYLTDACEGALKGIIHKHWQMEQI